MGPLPSYCVLVEVPKASRLKWSSDCKLFAPPVRSRLSPLGLSLTTLERFEVSGYAHTAAERYERGAGLHDWDKTISRDCELKRNQGIYNVSTPLLVPA